MTSFDAMLDTWQDVGLGALVVAAVVVGVDRLRHASRRCDSALESVAASSEEPELRVTIPAQRTGGER